MYVQNASQGIRIRKLKCSRRSLIGLNAVNYFAAELASVIGPFLALYLHEKNWTYAQIGMATAAIGLGQLLFQTPAGYIVDVYKNRKRLLAIASITLGVSFVLLPFVAQHSLLVTALLFLTGAAGSFLVPLLATLALSLVAKKQFSFVTGQNQSWNHAGNITAAVLALFIVRNAGVEPVFYMLALVAMMAVVSLALIRDDELDVNASGGAGEEVGRRKMRRNLLRFARDPQTRLLLLCVVLFHLSNSPGLPLIGLFVKKMGANDSFVAWAVLIAQGVMIPVAFLTGETSEKFGRRPLMIFAFSVLILRYLLYTFVVNQNALLAIQILDAIGAGVYGVVITLICRDLTDAKGGFNLLMGIAQTALALGAFVGPLLQGFAIEAMGFRLTFLILAVIAALGLGIFVYGFKETRAVD